MLSPARLDKPCCGLQVQTFLQFVHKKEQDNNHKLLLFVSLQQSSSPLISAIVGPREHHRNWERHSIGLIARVFLLATCLLLQTSFQSISSIDWCDIASFLTRDCCTSFALTIEHGIVDSDPHCNQSCNRWPRSSLWSIIWSFIGSSITIKHAIIWCDCNQTCSFASIVVIDLIAGEHHCNQLYSFASIIVIKLQLFIVIFTCSTKLSIVVFVWHHHKQTCKPLEYDSRSLKGILENRMKDEKDHLLGVADRGLTIVVWPAWHSRATSFSKRHERNLASHSTSVDERDGWY